MCTLLSILIIVHQNFLTQGHLQDSFTSKVDNTSKAKANNRLSRAARIMISLHEEHCKHLRKQLLFLHQLSTMRCTTRLECQKIKADADCRKTRT